MRFAANLSRAIQNPRRTLRHVLRGLLFRSSLVSPIVRLIGPSGAAQLAAAVIEPPNRLQKAPSVLVLDRLYFEKDVDILRRRGTLNYFTLHTHVLSVAQEVWLPQSAQIQVDYITEPNAENGFAVCQEYASSILQRAKARYDIVAVLASNVDYWQHEGFRRACSALGLPFLVLNQELQTVPSVYKLSVDMYRRTGFRFRGQACAVFGKATADMLLESECCTADQVCITGAPRLDPWLDGSVATVNADTITLLAFDGDQYFAPKCYVETLLQFAQLSMAYPAMRFVLKTKDAQDQANAFLYLKGISHRLHINHAFPLTELFSRSRLVIGFMSIAVYEALLSDAAVAVPQWADANKPAHDLNLNPSDEVTRRNIMFLRGAEEMNSIVAMACAGPISIGSHKERRAIVFSHFADPGAGGATARVEEFICSMIAAGK